MKNMILRATLVAALSAGAAGVAWSQAPADAISTRQAGYKSMGAATGAVKKGLEAGGNLSALAPRAQEIADFARRIPALFEPGSGPESGVKTRALPAIWQDKADFNAKANTLATEADKLVVALSANDKAAATAAFAATTSQCGACHRAYRAPEK